MSFLQKLPRKTWSFLNIINRLIKKDEERIFIYSNIGFRDNVRAIYEYLLENNFTDEYHITVSLNNVKKHKRLNLDNVKFTSNLKGLFSFFRCKYCFYCFGKYPVKPAPGQVVFNLWHGMPLKRVGNMVKGQEKTDYDYFTHILCTSEFFREIMKKSFNCDDEKIVICGQPRTDKMMHDYPPVKGREIKARFLGFDRRKNKVILWLPTFRENGASELDILSKEQFEKLNEICLKKNYAVFIKPHPLSSFKKENFEQYDGIKIITDQLFEYMGIDFYTVIRFSECLITDYSSVYFDYIMLDKPMAFVVSDMDEYNGDRGFVFDDPLEYMPGDIIRNGDDFLDFVQGVIEHKDNFKEKRRELCRTFNHYCDDQNCKRALDIAGVKIRGKLY